MCERGTALDKEALKRGTSIYLCDQVIPMLPKEISNGTCSLHPGEEKLTLTCEIHISASGQILKSRVYESSIISQYRLTYKEVQEIVDAGEGFAAKELLFGGKLTPDLQEALLTVKKLRNTLGKHKREK